MLRTLECHHRDYTVRPRKWRIFSPAKTPSFAKTAIFEALVWFTRFRGYVLFLQISNSKFYIEMTLHYISVLFERPCNLLYKLWLYNNIDLTRNLKKNRHFVRFYPVIYEKRELNTNRHLARSVTFEAVIFEVLLYYNPVEFLCSISMAIRHTASILLTIVIWTF